MIGDQIGRKGTYFHPNLRTQFLNQGSTIPPSVFIIEQVIKPVLLPVRGSTGRIGLTDDQTNLLYINYIFYYIV